MSPAFHCKTALLPEGWRDEVRIEVAAGSIVGIEIGVSPHEGDEPIAVAVPGVPNLHSHAFQRGMAGLAERRGAGDDSFWTWREVMYRFVGRLSPDDLQAIAALAYIEMLESGFTRVAEFHYLHHDLAGRPYDDPAEMSARIAAAAHDTGIGLTLLPVFYAHGGFGGRPPSSLQARFVHDPDSYGRLIAACRRAVASLPDAVIGIAPHSLRAATFDELRAILPLAEGGPVHIHIAEQIREVEECLAWSGARPVEWLLDRLPVDRRWCLVHATHMSESETRRLAESEAVAGLCPITEANLGDGLFPLAPYLAANGRYGVGSDSNVLIDLAEELRWLDYGQRLLHRSRNVAAMGPDAGTGAALFRSALQGGAQALGVVAGFITGAAADLVALDPDHPALLARNGDRLLDGFVFTGGPRAISAVWRRGCQVVSNGVHYRRAEVLARYREILADLLA